MSRGKNIKDKQQQTKDGADGDNNTKDAHRPPSSKPVTFGIGPSNPSDGPSYPEKKRSRGTPNPCSSGPFDPQDADYAVAPQFADPSELGNNLLFPGIPVELETMILARTGILGYKNLSSLSRRISHLVNCGELLRVRKSHGIREACVFMLASGDENWRAFGHQFRTDKLLPKLPADGVFRSNDKESLCAGTHLLVCGHEFDGPAIWAYDVVMEAWHKGPPMVEPRCLFASASSGDIAFVAGGIGYDSNDVLGSAERYDPEIRSWAPLPMMNEARKMCAGAYMENRFYVVGGQSKSGDTLTCGEVLDADADAWVRIPGMLDGLTTSNSPPLVAVVNDRLYLFETSSNCLMVYLKDTNSWRNLGPVPVRADLNRGWGVAFKSLGNELLVIGRSDVSASRHGMTIYTCRPDPNSEDQRWEHRPSGGNSRSHFIMNCTVMLA